MKHIVKLEPNKYLHLDTYRDDLIEPRNLLLGILSSCICIGIAAITVAAMLGHDITLDSSDGSTRRIPIQHGAQVETKR